MLESINDFQAFKEKNPQWPVVNDCTVEYVLGDDKFTCTAWINGKLACVVDFSYMGDRENTILDKVRETGTYCRDRRLNCRLRPSSSERESIQ